MYVAARDTKHKKRSKSAFIVSEIGLVWRLYLAVAAQCYFHTIGHKWWVKRQNDVNDRRICQVVKQISGNNHKLVDRVEKYELGAENNNF